MATAASSAAASLSTSLFCPCRLRPTAPLPGVQVDTIRAADHDIATGVRPDMTEHGAASDAWPGLYEKVLAADILVLAGPIWLGDNSSAPSGSSSACTAALTS
jgi:hypothetical protein